MKKEWLIVLFAALALLPLVSANPSPMLIDYIIILSPIFIGFIILFVISAVNIKKHKKWAIIGMIISAVLFVSLYALIEYGMNESKKSSYSYKCTTATVTIESTSAEGNSVTIQRRTGEAENLVKSIKILANGNAVNILAVMGINCTQDDDADTIENCAEEDEQGYTLLGLKQLETKTYILDYDLQPGDKVQVAPILGDNMYVCELQDTATAE